MDNLLLIGNPIALIALFVYQHFRLKFLARALAEQRTLIAETKDVVTQQATAISSQATVVDTAIRYSQSFAPEKIENLVRREVELDFAGEKLALERQVEELKGQNSEYVRQATAVLEKGMVDISEKITVMFSPIVVKYASVLAEYDQETREQRIAELESEEARTLLTSIFSRLELRQTPK